MKAQRVEGKAEGCVNPRGKRYARLLPSEITRKKPTEVRWGPHLRMCLLSSSDLQGLAARHRGAAFIIPV